MNKEDLEKCPKKILCEIFFQLGMQAQSQKMTLAEGWGGFDGDALDKAIKKNEEQKECIIKIICKK